MDEAPEAPWAKVQRLWAEWIALRSQAATDSLALTTAFSRYRQARDYALEVQPRGPLTSGERP